MSGNQPDYSLGALDSASNEKNPKIGAAWKNEDGSISININDFVVLRGSKTLYLRLFPIIAKKPDFIKEGESPKPYTTNNLQDDIPF